MQLVEWQASERQPSAMSPNTQDTLDTTCATRGWRVAKDMRAKRKRERQGAAAAARHSSRLSLLVRAIFKRNRADHFMSETKGRGRVLEA
jgi:hypothetical protein